MGWDAVGMGVLPLDSQQSADVFEFLCLPTVLITKRQILIGIRHQPRLLVERDP